MSAKITLSDAEIVSIIYGQRRLMAKHRGDLRTADRRHLPPGLVQDIHRQLNTARTLHTRFMDLATAHGIVVPMTRFSEQQ